MLHQLYIQNYVIIDELTIKPGNHLNVITGETGAGKSIILGALGLILGERADASTLRDKERKCFVEAQFDVHQNEAFLQLLIEEELDADNTCIIRREIGVNGKSRSFINDTPVTLAVLTKLTSHLVDLHQQFGHLALKEDHFQMEVIDAVANNQTLVKEYQREYLLYKKLEREIEAQKNQQLQAQKEEDYKQFLFDELDQLSFKENEIEEAEAQLKQLNHAERILQVLQQARTLLAEGENPLLNELKRTIQNLQTLNDIVTEVAPLNARMNTAFEELKDVAYELENLENNISIEPEKMMVLQERVDAGYKLLKKHGFQTTNELINLHQELSSELQSNKNRSEDISEMEKEKQKQLSQLTKTAQQLSKNRKKELAPLEKQLNELLKLVGMPNADLKIEMQALAAPTERGLDSIVFLFDGNKTGNYSPIYKAASGGEMSRIMLSIKSLTAKAMQLPTLIFDEVDTGISGEAAKQVGLLLKDLGKYHQVICITHQPQVAAKADTHFYVYKDGTDNARITARLKELSNKDHIFAIAQMIGGENPSETALKNAKELAL